jgi:hypothetical protein
MPTTFPVHKAAEPWSDHEGKGFHCSADATLTAQGQIWLNVTTSTNSWGLGFHSTSSVFALTADGSAVYVSPLRVVVVDAKSVFWGKSVRTEHYWSDWVPSDRMHEVADVKILLGSLQVDQWQNDWKKVADGVAAVEKAATTVVTALGTIIKDAKLT